MQDIFFNHSFVLMQLFYLLSQIWDVNAFRIILCQEGRELCSLHIQYLQFLYSYFLSFLFAHGPIWYKQFLNRSIWPINRTQTGTTTLDHSEPGSNDNEGILHIPQISRTEVYCHTQDTSFFFLEGGGTILKIIFI